MTSTAPQVAPWRIVELGRLTTPDAYRTALFQSGCKVAPWAGHMLSQVPCEQTPRRIQLVVQTVAQLGFTLETPYAAICERATRQGLLLCSAEVGPALRLDYLDQPEDLLSSLVVGMRAIENGHAEPRIFGVNRIDQDLALYGTDGGDDHVWRAVTQFIFTTQ